MKKKFLSILMAGAMAASLFAGCGSAESTDNADNSSNSDESGTSDENAEIDYGSGEITIWVAEEMVELTQELADAFIAEKGVDYTISIESVSESDAAAKVIVDVDAAADIYSFPQDQLARLVGARALQQLNDTYATWVEENNDAGSVSAAKSGDTTYAFPMTSDNGYFLYYDSSVVTDPTSLEQILADCEAAGKTFCFDADGAWYNMAFFFATGCTVEFETDDEANFTGYTTDLASDAGVVAYKALINMIESSAFVDSASMSEISVDQLGAIVDGTWDASAVQDALGDNYACAKLPSFTGADGNTYQLSGFGGFKLLGVKPQTDGGKLALCYELAQYLTDTEAQLARFDLKGWGPSNLAAQEDDAVQENEALSALAEQLAYTIPQGQYPDGWWDLAGALAADVESGTITSSSSDDELLKELQIHDDGCAAYITN